MTQTGQAMNIPRELARATFRKTFRWTLSSSTLPTWVVKNVQINYKNKSMFIKIHDTHEFDVIQWSQSPIGDLIFKKFDGCGTELDMCKFVNPKIIDFASCVFDYSESDVASFEALIAFESFERTADKPKKKHNPLLVRGTLELGPNCVGDYGSSGSQVSEPISLLKLPGMSIQERQVDGMFYPMGKPIFENLEFYVSNSSYLCKTLNKFSNRKESIGNFTVHLKNESWKFSDVAIKSIVARPEEPKSKVSLSFGSMQLAVDNAATWGKMGEWVLYKHDTSLNNIGNL